MAEEGATTTTTTTTSTSTTTKPAPFAEGDWTCEECGNLNFARRATCNRCEKGKAPGGGALKKRKLGTEIGKAAAEKSRGLFSADDWQCNKCGNVNWARRQQCNVCNAPKFGEVEERTGFGGGYNDRGVVEYKEREDSDDEFDEFGRRKKRRVRSGSSSGSSGSAGTNNARTGKEKNKENEDAEREEDEDDDDDEEEEEEEDDDDDDGDLSKYDLSDWGEDVKVDANKENKKSKSNSPGSKE